MVLTHRPGHFYLVWLIDLGHHPLYGSSGAYVRHGEAVALCVRLCVQTARYVETLEVTNDHHSSEIHAQQGISGQGWTREVTVLT